MAVIDQATGPRPSIFVGRARELAELEAELDQSMLGRLRTVMVIGEPGIGKTTLAEQLCVIAEARGARVAWGRCWDGAGTRPYWPWVQVMRALTQGSAIEQGASTPHPQSVLAELLTFERAAPEEVSPQERHGPGHDGGRGALFDSVAEVIGNISASQPLVVVLDDLHEADVASLLLLQFVARVLRHSRAFFLCTYRETEIGRSHPLVEPLGLLTRESSHLVLRGLSSDDIRQILAAVTGVPPRPELVDAVYEHTDGNPFFVMEIVHQLRTGEAGDPGACPRRGFEVPRGVRGMIGGQLRALSATAEEVLAVAAVLGRRFGAAMVARVLAMSGEAVIGALNEAVDAHLVRPDGDGPDRFAFVHSLTRETIYEYIGPAKKAFLHRRVGETVEAMAATDVTPVLADLAHHFYQALPEVDPDKAFDYSVRAGRQAGRRLAYEEAAQYFENALRALDMVGGDPEGRCRLLLELGDARSRAGATSDAHDVFLEAAGIARRIDHAELLAQAALGYGGRFPGLHPGFVDDRLIHLLEEALEALGGDDSALRASLLARLSRALYYAGETSRRRALAREALDIAERCGDHHARLSALNSRYWSLECPEESCQRLATAEEMLSVAAAVGDKEMELQGHHWRLGELAERGDMNGVDREIDAYGRLAEEIRQPLYRWYRAEFAVMRAVVAGRFAEAERLAQEAATRWGDRLPGVAMGDLVKVRLLDIWWQQGRLSEARALLDEEPLQAADPSSRAVAALIAFRFDSPEVASDELRRLVNDDLGALPRDVLWTAKVAALAAVCAGLYDAERAPPLYELLVPYRERVVVGSGGLACSGPVAYYLALLAATVGQPSQAVSHFEDALARSSAMGARPQVAWTQYELARVLVASAPRVRSQRAIQLLSDCIATTEELGMRTLMRRAMKLRYRARRAGGARAGASAERRPSRPKGVNVFCAEDDHWTVEFQGTCLELKDAKGVRYLHKLLQFPGKELHVVELAGERPVGQAPQQEAERTRKAVTNRINATIRTLEQRDPELAEHLATSIRTGRYCSYRPLEPTNWQL